MIKNCPKCGSNFKCTADESCFCWVYELNEIQLKALQKIYSDCLCEHCLIKISDKSCLLIKDEDYYIDNGNYVFTDTYLLRRGSCCSSGCRHCPYIGVNSESEWI